MLGPDYAAVQGFIAVAVYCVGAKPKRNPRERPNSAWAIKHLWAKTEALKLMLFDVTKGLKMPLADGIDGVTGRPIHAANLQPHADSTL
jgi:hypothetical protein